MHLKIGGFYESAPQWLQPQEGTSITHSFNGDHFRIQHFKWYETMDFSP